MSDPQGLATTLAPADDLEKTVQEIVQRSNRKASLQPAEVQRAMSSYLEPEDSSGKPWETWL